MTIADELWTGARRIEDTHPFSRLGDAEEVADGVAFVPSFATGAGLVLVDSGSLPFASHVHATVRAWDGARLDTAVFSHGHIDHVFGVAPFEEESATNGWAPPRVVGHEAIAARFDRYQLTAGYNEVVNQRQFGLPDLRWTFDYRYPDVTYCDTLDLQVGGLDLRLTHTLGETDDHTYTWVPERKVLCCGDLFIWASPNAGNPQTVQRFPIEWARALRIMADLGAELMLPGHGVPVSGADRIRQALTESAELLEHLRDQTVAMMNAGARLDEIVHTVKAPQHLLDRPYLRPVYDEPEVAVRNVWRLYGGWWDGDPAHLKPAPASALATELANLAGGAQTLADRALSVLEAGTTDWRAISPSWRPRRHPRMPTSSVCGRSSSRPGPPARPRPWLRASSPGPRGSPSHAALEGSTAGSPRSRASGSVVAAPHTSTAPLSRAWSRVTHSLDDSSEVVERLRRERPDRGAGHAGMRTSGCGRSASVA